MATALDAVKQAGRLIDLSDRIASSWAEVRERKLSRSIGESAGLAMDLQRILKISREEADQAAEQFFEPSYSQVAIEALLQFAKELLAPSRIRPIEQVRQTWNPHDAGLAPEDLRGTEPPEGEPAAIPPAIRRATTHAIEHKVKARRAGR